MQGKYVRAYTCGRWTEKWLEVDKPAGQRRQCSNPPREKNRSKNHEKPSQSVSMRINPPWFAIHHRHCFNNIAAFSFYEYAKPKLSKGNNSKTSLLPIDSCVSRFQTFVRSRPYSKTLSIIICYQYVQQSNQ